MHEVVFDKVDKMQSSTLSIRPRSFEPNRSTGIYKSAMCVRACVLDGLRVEQAACVITRMEGRRSVRTNNKWGKGSLESILEMTLSRCVFCVTCEIRNLWSEFRIFTLLCKLSCSVWKTVVFCNNWRLVHREEGGLMFKLGSDLNTLSKWSGSFNVVCCLIYV